MDTHTFKVELNEASQSFCLNCTTAAFRIRTTGFFLVWLQQYGQNSDRLIEYCGWCAVGHGGTKGRWMFWWGIREIRVVDRLSSTCGLCSWTYTTSFKVKVGRVFRTRMQEVQDKQQMTSWSSVGGLISFAENLVQHKRYSLDLCLAFSGPSLSYL